MQKDLYLLAKNSIAFNSDYIENLNRKVAQVDSRLYLFAYYHPKKLPLDIDARGCFNLAVLNMYGLLWDCGKMVMNNLFSNNTSSRPLIIQALIDSSSNSFCSSLFSIISNVRTCICHNNSDRLFYNREKQNKCQIYIDTITGETETFDTLSEAQWGSLCKDFLDRCQRFVSILDCLVNQLIRESDQNKKNEFIQFWLNSLSNWYKFDLGLFDHVLADRYKLKALSMRRGNNVITKRGVKSWVEIGWKNMNKTSQISNYYDDYISNCVEKIPAIIDDPDCPKPAFPLDVLVKATTEATMFAFR